MEPGEYLTNVLSCHNYAAIQYDYYEPQCPSPTTRRNLQKVETNWRQDGYLVHCDTSREGIWVFRNVCSKTTDVSVTESMSTIAEIAGLDLSVKEKGIYDPAVLTRSKSNNLSSLSNLSATSVASSPSASFENHLKSGSDNSLRRSQTAESAHNTSPPLRSPGLKNLAAGEPFPSPKNIHESFISAALGSIVFFLCRDHGFTPLNPRTLITTSLKKSTSDNLMSCLNPITLATLDISLTSLGTLVVKAYTDTTSGLQSIVASANTLLTAREVSTGSTLWLAPGGNVATFYGARDENNLPGSLPISQLQKGPLAARQHPFDNISIQSWQSKCLDWMSAKGLNITALEEGGWVFVQILGGNLPYLNADFQRVPILEDVAIIPWPALLCFQTSGNESINTESIPIGVTTRDPLSFAEEWFTAKDTRASILLKRQKDRQLAEAKLKEQADVESRNFQSITHSPAALRRGSNVGAMYPTPPDAPNHPIGATPSFDGQVSTPGNPLFAQDMEAFPQTVIPGAMDTEADTWGSSDRKDRAQTSMAFNENDTEHVNDLFGDVGGDLFGDITDADFSFFDEPDAHNNNHGLAMSGQSSFFQTQAAAAAAAEALITEAVEAAVPEIADILMEDTIVVEQGNLQPPKTITEMQPPSIPKESKPPVVKIERVIPDAAPVVSPPFNKEAIFEKLAAISSGSRPRRHSIFNKVNFASSVLSVDDKYGANGRFSIPSKRMPMDLPKPFSFPEKGYLERRQKTDDRQSAEALVRGSDEPHDTLEFDTTDDGTMQYILDSDMASPMSEADDASQISGDKALVLSHGVKRKRETDNEGGDEMTSSFNALVVDYEKSVDTPVSTSGSQLPILGGDPADWPLTPYLTSPDPDAQSTMLSDSEYIAAAQILTDQAISGTSKLPVPPSKSIKDCQASHRTRTRELMQSVAKASKSCFQDLAACNLQSYIEIQGIPVLNQGLRLPQRPTPKVPGLDTSRPNNSFSIHPPRLEVRRADSALTILPSATSFWENLGLGPSNGNKDVSAICVHPDLEGLAKNASSFLDQMQSVYESFRFGSHEKIASTDLVDSLLPFTVESLPTDNPHTLAGLEQPIDNLMVLKDAMTRLSRAVLSLSVRDMNIVVYFIYPIDNAALLPHICTAFQHLFVLYRRALIERKINTANELVLQLVPMDFIACSTSIAVPLPSQYARLAMEVYDRCVNFSTASPVPAILLEQQLPKSIDFKMTPNPSASVLQENTCLHVAYAQSIDDRWITAAWTDNRGTQQMTASYCLGRKNEPIATPFSDIANEIWETTMTIVHAKKIHWRVMITRVGVMDPSEIEFWAGLQSTESEAQINLTLLTVQTDPSLRLLPPSVTLSPNPNTSQSVITPVSTPQALQSTIVSPENATPPARDAGGSITTPGENPTEPDADARLIDYTDQSWGAVLAHRLNNSNSLLETTPALISGYLLKRGGTNLDDPLIVMEVNIVYSEVVGNPRTFHEGLLREILGYYRNLGTLARVRGVVDPVQDVRPWHVAAAEKAVKALYVLM